ncbi:MAG: tetratricopeptide repeat protein [Acidobacteriota bacterium]
MRTIPNNLSYTACRLLPAWIVLSILVISVICSGPLFSQDNFKRNAAIRHFNEGVRFEKTGEIGKAIEAYEKAINADPYCPFPFLNLGSVYFSRGDFLLAKYFYLISLKNDPSYSKAKENLEICERRLPSLQGEELNILASRSFSMGKHLAGEGKFCEAAQEFMRFVGGMPDQSEGYIHAGKALLGCKRYSLAERNLTIAALLSEMDRNLILLLAEAYEGMGDIRRALQMNKIAIQKGEYEWEEEMEEEEKAKSSVAQAEEDADKRILEKIADLEKRVVDLQAMVLKFENQISGYLSFLSEKGKSDLEEFIFNRIAEGVEEKIIREEIEKALQMNISGLNFDNGSVEITLPPGWYQASEETKPGSPFAVFRKWPGDSQLAFYAIDAQGEVGSITLGSGKPGRAGEALNYIVEAGKKLAGAQGTDAVVANQAGGFSNADYVASFDVYHDAGDKGSAPVRWWLFYIEGSPNFCMAAGIAGSGGLDAEEKEKILSEMERILAHLRFNRETWSREGGISGSLLYFPFPPEYQGMSPFSEKEMPWTVIQGQGFTLLLPPGIIGKRLDASSPQRTRASMVMWFRGGFTDASGREVKVGDKNYSGYMDILDFDSRGKSHDYVSGRPSPAPPPPDTEAKLISGEDYTEIARETAGADTSWVGKFQGKGFSGKWLIFRMSFDKKALEFGFPILKGEDSSSLFWIPTTFRMEGLPPAFPPEDPAERFKMTFKRASPSEKSVPLGKEGEFITPDFAIDVPAGWRVSLNYRSVDGYPITLKEYRKNSTIKILKLKPGKGLDVAMKEAQEWICGGCSLTWAPLEKPKKHGARKALHASLEKKEAESIRIKTVYLFENQKDDLFVAHVELADGWDASIGEEAKMAVSSLFFSK